MKINREELLQVLEAVKPALGNEIEQSDCFYIADGFVAGYDDHIFIVATHDMELPTGLVPGDELLKILHKIKADTVVVEEGENEILIKAGRTKCGISLQKKTDLPFREINFKMKYKPIHSDFESMASLAMHGCSKDKNDPVLSTVHINSDGFVEATDRYRIFHCSLSKPLPIETVLIPQTSLKEALKIEPNLVSKFGSWVYFKNGNLTVICRTFNDKFLDTAPFLDVKGTEFDFPEEILETIERARIFAKRDIVYDEQIQVTVADKIISVSGNSDVGWFEEKFKLKYKGPEIKISVAPVLLIDILKITRTCTIGENAIKFQADNWVYTSALFE